MYPEPTGRPVLYTVVHALPMADTEESAYVKLISAEGHEFYLDRKCATLSGTIKAMLSGHFAESSGEVKFPEISTPILEKVIQYFYYKHRCTNSQSVLPAINFFFPSYSKPQVSNPRIRHRA